jgi:hypothetical protein
MNKLEAQYQAGLIKRLKEKFPGILVLKNDPNWIQGIPDLTLIYHKRWAMLECKRSYNAPHRPNQDYYIEKLNLLSYAAFVYPENEEVIMHDLEHALH